MAYRDDFMSREIKFRGLHPPTKTIMDVCVIDWMHDEVYFEQGTDVSYPIDECNLMQYTGLKDRNGVECYEGDVVMCYPDLDISYIKVVEWDAESPSLGITTNGRSGATLCKHNQDILEVIGNIHLNPDLLQ